MDIADLARRSGVPASTLRYYANRGLLPSSSAAGARRQFMPDALHRLGLIALGQAGGLSLDEIATMLTPEGAATVDRATLLARADALDAAIARLRAMSAGLRHVAQCPAPSHAECPTFQRLVKAAAAGRLCPPGDAAPGNAAGGAARRPSGRKRAAG